MFRVVEGMVNITDSEGNVIASVTTDDGSSLSVNVSNDLDVAEDKDGNRTNIVVGGPGIDSILTKDIKLSELIEHMLFALNKIEIHLSKMSDVNLEDFSIDGLNH